MKNKSNLWFISTILLLATILIAAKITDNTLRIGDDNPAVDKLINMSDGQIKWDSSSAKLRFTNDGGSQFFDLGSGSGGGGGSINLLENADFEIGDPPDNWTPSGASTFIAELGSPGFGSQSGEWDASATGEFLTSDLANVPVGLQGQDCLAQINYLWDAGSNGDIKLQVLDDLSNIRGQVDLEQTSGLWRKAQLAFTCPSAGSPQMQLRLASTADAAVIFLDNTHNGSDIREIEIAQAELYGTLTYNGGASCFWSSTTGSYINYTATGACNVAVVTGRLSAPTTKIPGFRMQNALPGNYYIAVAGLMETNGSSTNCRWRLSDGTTNFSEVGNFETGAGDDNNSNSGLTGNITYETTQADVTIQFQVHRVSGAGACRIKAGDVETDLTFNVYRFPTTTQQAIITNIDKSGWFIEGNIGGSGTDVVLSGSSESTLAALNDNDLDLVLRPGSAPARIGCIQPNPPEGLDCNSGGFSESLSIAWDPPKINARYRVCMYFPHLIDTTNGGVDVTFTLIQTPLNALSILQQSNVFMPHRSQTDGSSGRIFNEVPITICGTFKIESTGEVLVRLMYEQLLTGVVTNNLIRVNRNVSLAGRELFVSVELLDQNVPAAVFNNAVTSPEPAPTKLVSAYVEDSGVIRQDGNWISSKVNDVTGKDTLNITNGTFSIAPNCMISAVNTSTSRACHIDAIPTTSIITTICLNTDTDALANLRYSIICVGAR